MFDTMVLTKLIGAFCGALLIFLLGKWVADEMYVPLNDKASQAYVIDTGAAPDDAEPEEAVTFADLIVGANADAGARVWNQCRACHALEEGNNGVGPYLHGIIGRDISAVDGFNYSGALAQLGDAWTPELIDAFIANPRSAAPGTSMSFNGISNPQDRANLIAYIAMESGQQLTDFVETAATAEANDAEPVAEEAAEQDAPPPAEEEAAADEAPEQEAAEPGEAEQAGTDTANAGDSDFAQLVASFAPEDGSRVWNQCRACHALEEGVNRVGPSLHGIVGGEVGTEPGFRYSGALDEVADTWTYDNLSAFLANPRDYAPGTSMSFAGVRNEEDRAKLIRFLEAQ